MNKPIDKDMDKLINSLRSTLFILLEDKDAHIATDALVGNLAEFLALWQKERLLGDIKELCEMLTDAGINPPTRFTNDKLKGDE